MPNEITASEMILEFLYLAIERYEYKPEQAVNNLVEVNSGPDGIPKQVIEAMRSELSERKTGLPDSCPKFWDATKIRQYMQKAVGYYDTKYPS